MFIKIGLGLLLIYFFSDYLIANLLGLLEL